MFASIEEILKADNIESILFVITWVLTVAVPAAIAIYYSIKNGQYKKAVSTFVDVIESSSSPNIKSMVRYRMLEEINDKIVNPTLKSKNLLNKSKSDSINDGSNERIQK